MTDETPQEERKKASGYHGGSVDSVISVEEVNRQATAMAEPITWNSSMRSPVTNHMCRSRIWSRVTGRWKFCMIWICASARVSRCV